jgi:hypothetical protein
MSERYGGRRASSADTAKESAPAQSRAIFAVAVSHVVPPRDTGISLRQED